MAKTITISDEAHQSLAVAKFLGKYRTYSETLVARLPVGDSELGNTMER